jgi:hypothetical protein
MRSRLQLSGVAQSLNHKRLRQKASFRSLDGHRLALMHFGQIAAHNRLGPGDRLPRPASASLLFQYLDALVIAGTQLDLEAAQHLWNHRHDLFTFLSQPGPDATNWRAELAIRFGVILRKVWGGSRTWTGALAQSVLMSVLRTCWQQGRSALDFLSQLLRGTSVALALPP